MYSAWLSQIASKLEEDMKAISELVTYQFQDFMRKLNKNNLNNFYLQDWNSKFGTLVQVKKPVKIINKPEAFQLGRSVFTISVIKPWKIWDCINILSDRKNKSKVGMISLNGKDFIPKEYLEIEERPGNTNSVDELSDYLK